VPYKVPKRVQVQSVYNMGSGRTEDESWFHREESPMRCENEKVTESPLQAVHASKDVGQDSTRYDSIS
jgi:hypothetical protein